MTQPLMQPAEFARLFTDAFAGAELPLLLSYTDNDADLPAEPVRGCFIKALRAVRDGRPLALDAKSITCPGGRMFTGFGEHLPRIDEHVSRGERYKQSPELFREYVDSLDLKPAPRPRIRFARLDTADTFENVEGLIFFATPDVLSGLVDWALYDTNALDAVSTPFGSGCATLVAQTVAENRRNGSRCFLGMFDISARPFVEENVLSFSMPLSRFRTMAGTMQECFLGGAHAWTRLRERIADAN